MKRIFVNLNTTIVCDHDLHPLSIVLKILLDLCTANEIVIHGSVKKSYTFRRKPCHRNRM